MRTELENMLARRYKFMRKGKTLIEQKSEGFIGDLYSVFGCECGDGWYQILDELCSEIEKIINESDSPVDLEVNQIKEKFGTLRFNVSIDGPEKECTKIEELIQEAEQKSASICEECGKPGIIRDDLGWILTLCDDCYVLEVARSLMFEFDKAFKELAK